MTAPPVARVALAYAAGVAWGVTGAPIWTAPLLATVCAAAPIGPWRRPGVLLRIAVVCVGALSARVGSVDRCPPPTPGQPAEVRGRFLASTRAGAAPFVPRHGCAPFTVVTSDELPAGVPLVLEGRWMEGARRPWLRAEPGRARRLDGRSARPWAELRWAPVRWRAGLTRRIDRLYGARAPLVAALTLARREGMDRTLRDAFARTGIAHLLAISGFHVGLIAVGVLTALRRIGLSRRRSLVGAASLTWLYVGLIGFPDAACRAAVILTLVAVARAAGRPPARWGALSTALVLLLVLDPERVTAPGFQLSFLGAAGLVAWARTVTDSVVRHTRGRCPRDVASAIGAGVAATAATLPAVAWHFEQLSLVGIPTTLVATPLVALALPGAIASVALDFVSPSAASFLAGGVDLLLALLAAGTTWVSDLPWASAPVARPTVLAGSAGCLVAVLIARRPRIGAAGRRRLVATYVACGLLAWPMVVRVGGWGTLRVVAIDVGQGDAIALRSPRGRWMLVDAGPPTVGRGGLHPVVRALRARGVTKLESVVLTHPDLDHVGGAMSVLEHFDVGRVRDPALPAPKAEYLDLLRRARTLGVPWVAARAGQRIDFDGAWIEVLHPRGPEDGVAETNEASVVLVVRWGDFDVLLTGDAYRPTERRLLDAVGDVEVLKVGHHGSATSTDPELLRVASPEVALVSVGRYNRYGHPAEEVLERLRRAGVDVRRTDREGTVTVVGRPDGSYDVRSRR